jgi:hypothetical protein
MSLPTFNVDLGQATIKAVQAFSTAAKQDFNNNTQIRNAYSTYFVRLDAIQKALNANLIDQDTAQTRIDAAKHTLRAAIFAEAGLGLVALQNAINAGIQAFMVLVGAALSAALKFTI